MHTRARAHHTHTHTHTQAKAASFWRENSASADGKGVGKVGKEFEYTDDWGELAVGKVLSRVFVLHVPSKSVKLVEGIPTDLAAGQAIWDPAGTAIIFTAFPVCPRRLGVRFYNTRKSRIALVPAPTFLSPAPPALSQQGMWTSYAQKCKHTRIHANTHMRACVLACMHASIHPSLCTHTHAYSPAYGGQHARAGMSTSAASAAPKPDLIRWLSSEEQWSARSPKLSPDGTKMVSGVSARAPIDI